MGQWGGHSYDSCLSTELHPVLGLGPFHRLRLLYVDQLLALPRGEELGRLRELYDLNVRAGLRESVIRLSYFLRKNGNETTELFLFSQ